MTAVTPERTPRMGDIGEPRRRETIEPFPEHAPVTEPAPVIVPAEPEKVPA